VGSASGVKACRASLFLVLALMGMQAACSCRSSPLSSESGAPDAAPTAPPVAEAAVKTSASPYADVWCEGLTVDRCGAFAEDCVLKTYCDGQRFCSRRRARPPAGGCGAEGAQGLAEPCCEGLVPRCGSRTLEDACEPRRDSTDVPMCLRCGDGVCGFLEQRCNCPEDCESTKARPLIHYRGPRPGGPAPTARDVPAGVKSPGQCLESLDAADPIRRCLWRWAHDVLGRDDARELRRAANLAPFTVFDLDLMECLDEMEMPGEARSARKRCLEALMLRTKDARLQKLLTSSPPTSP